MERAIEMLACIQFLIIGLSHLLQPQAWVAFFMALREKGPAGAFVNGFLTLPFGALIVSFHNVWSGLPMILTLIGWGQIVKALVNFTAPRHAMRGWELVGADRAWEFRAAGLLSLGISGLMAYILVTTR